MRNESRAHGADGEDPDDERRHEPQRDDEPRDDARDEPDAPAPDDDFEPDAELVDELYQELRKIAGALLRGQRPGQTFGVTAVVNEAFCKLHRIERNWSNRYHYLRSFAKAMRTVLIDAARRREVKDRRLGAQVELDPSFVVDLGSDRQAALGDLNDELDALERDDPAMRLFLELRFFSGASMAECSEILGIPLSTLEKRWKRLRAYLLERLGGDDEDDGSDGDDEAPDEDEADDDDASDAAAE